jgi:hypothetical protein
MHRFLLLLAFTCPSVFCFGQQYQLIGRVEGLQADTILILKIKSDYEIDKIPVKNGRFRYRDSISEPFFVQLMTIDPATQETTGKMTELMVEPGKIRITGVADDFESFTVKGSASDRVLKEYFAADQAWTDQWSALKVEYDAYVEQGDTVNRKKMAVQLNNITNNERVPLLKRYVRDYRASVIGALLPNFCTLEQVLNPVDYEEMYRALDAEIQSTAYGQSLRERAMAVGEDNR